MQLKLFILPVKNLAAAEAEMNAFLRSHRVLMVKKELVADGENSLWWRNHLPCAGWRMRC
jgi:phage protein D